MPVGVVYSRGRKSRLTEGNAMVSWSLGGESVVLLSPPWTTGTALFPSRNLHVCNMGDSIV